MSSDVAAQARRRLGKWVPADVGSQTTLLTDEMGRERWHLVGPLEYDVPDMAKTLRKAIVEQVKSTALRGRCG